MYVIIYIFSALLIPSFSLASSFVPLVGLPGVDGTMDFSTYMNALYALSISIAALLAVVKIIIAGVKWMLTDVVTSKGEAKKDIEGALIGLLVVVAAVLILTVINPDLIRLKPFEALSTIDTSVPASAISPTGTTGPTGPQTCEASVDGFICSCTEITCPANNRKVVDVENCVASCVPIRAEFDEEGNDTTRYRLFSYECTDWLSVRGYVCVSGTYKTDQAESDCKQALGQSAVLETLPNDPSKGRCYVPETNGSGPE